MAALKRPIHQPEAAQQADPAGDLQRRRHGPRLPRADRPNVLDEHATQAVSACGI